MRTTGRPKKTPWSAALGFALAGLVAVGLGIATLPAIERFFLKRSADESAATLRIAVEGLDSTLERFEPLPKLIAERPILSQLLKDPTNEGLLPFVNEQLRLTAMSLGVSDVYLMDIGGLTIASSNYREEFSFVGYSFNYRPYFQQALEGGLGRYFARGTTSGKRGYFFAAPVLDGTRVIGVVAVKFLVAPFEKSWSGGPHEIIVTDLSDIIFMSSRPDWQFRTLSPPDPSVLDEIAETRQYPLDRIRPLQNEIAALDEGITILTVREDEASDYVRTSQFLPEVGWRVQLLTPAGPARTQALTVLALAGLVLLLLTMAGTLVWQRLQRARERDEEQRAAKEELERRVRQRTADLNAANLQLMNEIDERRATEERLRSTQKELVQAGKLAALGQMSAALSHEINQPLAAVKSYADNASAYLDRDRTLEARENMRRISEMADRMATLSGHLRNFARRPQESLGPVDLSGILDDALELMEARLRATGTTVSRDPATKVPIWVQGGKVRLQQVFVNLINNAVDAMEGAPAPNIEITAETGERVRIFVRDCGPGLDETTSGRVFDPFFTTKSPGKGLGLGLSISFNIVEDFGGHLDAGNNPGRGAFFVVELNSADPQAPREVAAE